MKTLDDLVNELEALQQEGLGDAVVYVDTDVTHGLSVITEVWIESSDKIVLR